MGVVIPLFGSADVPAASEDEELSEFIDDHWGDFASAVNEFLGTADPAQAKVHLREVRALVEAWPEV